MSTKAIRDALEMLNAETDEQEEMVKRAIAEVEAIERAAKDFGNEPDDVSSSTWTLMESIAKDAP